MSVTLNDQSSLELQQKIQTAIDELQAMKQQLADADDNNLSITDENLIALCVRFFGEMYGEYLQLIKAQLQASGNYEPPVKGPTSQLGDIRRDFDSKEIYRISQLQGLYDEHREEIQNQFKTVIERSAQDDTVKYNLYVSGYLFPMQALLGILNRLNNR